MCHHLEKHWKKKCHLGEITVKGARGAKVKVLFQGLHMTHVILALVYNLKFYIQVPHLTLYFRYE
jgi:hypothetical protein